MAANSNLGNYPRPPALDVERAFPSLRHFHQMRQITEETFPMKAIVVTDRAAGTAGMKLVERPEPQEAEIGRAHV